MKTCRGIFLLVGLFVVLGVTNAQGDLIDPIDYPFTTTPNGYSVQSIGSAGTYTFSNSGQYLGTVMGQNDDMDVLQEVLDHLFEPNIMLASISKVDYPATTNGLLTVTYADGTEDGFKSGEWATFSPPDPDAIPEDAVPVDFYVVKGGNDFAIYYVDPAAAYGTWNVGNLPPNPNNPNNLNTIPTISHLSAYFTEPPEPPQEIPEPSTLLLLGSGLASLGFYGWRRKRS